MSNNTAVFLSCSRQKSRYINQCYQWNIEGIAETNKTSCFTRRINIENTCKITRLISHDTDRSPVKACKTYHNILCIITVHFQKFIVVNNRVDYVFYVVWFVRIIRNYTVERVFQTVDRIVASCHRSIFQIVLWHIAQHFSNQKDTFFFVLSHKMGNS